MNGNDLISTVERIRAEMRTKRCAGKAGKADEDYMGCISMLEACLSTGEMSADQRERVENAIADFKQYVDLGIIVNGRFSPVAPSQAARWNIVAGSVINMFPVLTKDEALHLLRHREVSNPNWRWDAVSSSLLTLSAFYRRYPLLLAKISEKEAVSLGLLDQHRQAAIIVGKPFNVEVESFDF